MARVGIVPVAGGTPSPVRVADTLVARQMRVTGQMLIGERARPCGTDLPFDGALALEQLEFLPLPDTLDKTKGMRAFLKLQGPNTGR